MQRLIGNQIYNILGNLRKTNDGGKKVMMKFNKLLENNLKIIYNVFDGTFGTVEYDKQSNTVKFFDEKGVEYFSSSMKFAFNEVVIRNFPDEYIYMAG